MDVWQIENGKARLQLPRFSAEVMPAEPAGGVQELRADQQPISGSHLLQVDWPVDGSQRSVVEHYLRGADLVATYAEQPDRPLRAKFYWRARASTDASTLAILELIACVHTDQWISCPTLWTHSELVASEAFQLVDLGRAAFASLVPKPDHSEVGDSTGLPMCFLFRLPGGKYSYAEMVQPADAQESSWDGWLAGQDFRLQLHHRLFSERLEKGVILKARILGVFLDREGDRAAAARRYSAFLAEELPLTA